MILICWQTWYCCQECEGIWLCCCMNTSATAIGRLCPSGTCGCVKLQSVLDLEASTLECTVPATAAAVFFTVAVAVLQHRQRAACNTFKRQPPPGNR
jgi:hypothetical protein